MPEIVIIAAVAHNGVIGQKGEMPWRLSSDLKRFRSLTLGKPVIMGRKTLQSIGKALPERINILVARNKTLVMKDIKITTSIREALDISFKTGIDKIFLIGGGEIYTQTIDLANVLQITHVDVDIEGDVFFPRIDPCHWKKGQESFSSKGKKDSYPTVFTTYNRY